MEKALEIVSEYADIPNKALTYLNLTTVLSEMQRYFWLRCGLYRNDKALGFARVGLRKA